MLDPFPLPPPTFLQRAIAPLASSLNLPTLPLHIHEVLFAFTLYHLVNTQLSPWLSSLLFPRTYAGLNRRTRINWDVHVVSMVQCCLINALAVWTIVADSERRSMGAGARVFGYTGAGGLIQALAAGYFLWDFVLCARHVAVFGPGLLAHAVSALVVFGLGFRPVFNYYGPVFILYELSTPFLNVHWFCDKLDLTGSSLQLYNGMALIASFFLARLCWGTYSSLRVMWDVYRTTFQSDGYFVPPSLPGSPGYEGTSKVAAALGRSTDPRAEITRFATGEPIPLWVCVVYLGANLTLHSLNFYWFGKMIETVRKRFDPPFGTKGRPEKKRKGKNGDDDRYGGGIVRVAKGMDADGHASVEVEAKEVRNRRRG